jgi:hypothetical protein
MAKRGDLPSFKVGGRRLLSVAALRRWVETRQAGHAESEVRHVN